MHIKLFIRTLDVNQFYSSNYIIFSIDITIGS